MSIVYEKYLLGLIILVVVWISFLFRRNEKIVSLVRERWNLAASVRYRLSQLFYYLFWCCLILSLLDWRGEEVAVEAKMPVSKTVLLIDTSASMFTEDVKPNRLKKSTMLARHIIKRIGGGEIAVLLFSDTVKKLVPFTSDRDLLDSRLTALDEMSYQDAGSNLYTAISETLGYISSETGGQRSIGNIIVLSDSETDERLSIIGDKKNINIAFIAVGTSKGGQIPIRDRNNVFRGYKESGGSTVVSKINEDNLKKLQSVFNNFKYWVVYSYSLPTDELLKFIHSSSSGDNEGVIRQRPVLTHYLILLAGIFLLMFIILRSKGAFKLASLVLVVTMFENGNADTTLLLEKFKNGEANDTDRSNLIAEYLNVKKFKEAAILAEEIKKNDRFETMLNRSTAFLASKNIEKGLNELGDMDYLSLDEEDKIKMRQNVLLAISQELNGKNGKSESDKDDDKKNGDEEGRQDQKDGKDGNSKSDQSNKGKDQNKDKEEQKSDQDKKDSSRQNSDKDDDQNKKNDQQKNAPNLTDKSKKNKSQLQGLMEQLKSDDKQLQKKFIDTSSRDNKRSGRDW
ncbi:MAG: hypothetical protein Fur0010_07770 [Bdellovibrio sp.]